MNANPPTRDTILFLKEQLEKPPQESKKWILINRGLMGILFIFIVSAVLLFVKPELAGNLTTLAQAVVTAWGGFLAIGVGAIAAVDYKQTAALTNVVQTVTDNQQTEGK